MRWDSSDRVSPSGVRSSCAIRSKRGKVTSKRSRKTPADLALDHGRAGEQTQPQAQLRRMFRRRHGRARLVIEHRGRLRPCRIAAHDETPRVMLLPPRSQSPARSPPPPHPPPSQSGGIGHLRADRQGGPADWCATKSASASSCERPVVAITFSMPLATMSVSVKPGQSALTVMPLRAVSSASARTRPSAACLAAQ